MGLNSVQGVEFYGGNGHVFIGTTEIPVIKMGPYNDHLDGEEVHQCGAQEIVATTDGMYHTDEFELVIRSYVFRQMIAPLFPSDGAGNIRLQMTTNYVNPLLGDDADFLGDCQCRNFGAAMEAAAKAMEVTTKWKPRYIQWTRNRITLYRSILNQAPQASATF